MERAKKLSKFWYYTVMIFTGKNASPKKWVREIISIFWIVFAVFAFRSSFFEPFRIPSGSMVPSLMIGDFILVNKFSYGFKVPYSDLSILGINWDPIYLFGKKHPKRGDVIVFKYPQDPSLNYIKRLIGLPGDEIQLIDKVVYVNGRPFERTQIDGTEIMADMDDKFKDYHLNFYQTKTGTHNHVIQTTNGMGHRDNISSIVVPPDHFFVMGDNRDFSADSRFWGFVPFKNVRGKALFVWFSAIFGLDKDKGKFRYHRIGTGID